MEREGKARMDGWLVGSLLKHGNEEALASFYTWPVGRRRFIYTAAIALRRSIL
jgi:hypothetical protein